MYEEERFQKALKQTYEKWYAVRGIKPEDTRAKIAFLRTQLCGTYDVAGPMSFQQELSLLEQAHFLEQIN